MREHLIGVFSTLSAAIIIWLWWRFIGLGVQSRRVLIARAARQKRLAERLDGLRRSRQRSDDRANMADPVSRDRERTAQAVDDWNEFEKRHPSDD